MLSREDARKRAIIVKHLISVADVSPKGSCFFSLLKVPFQCCRTLNNFSSMAAITTGLTTPPIHRLKRTWELVGQQSMEQFTTCDSTVECIKSLSKYRQVMDLVNPPCVPFIGKPVRRCLCFLTMFVSQVVSFPRCSATTTLPPTCYQAGLSTFANGRERLRLSRRLRAGRLSHLT